MNDADQRMLEPIERQTMTEVVAKRILTLISSGQLQPGDMLPPERDMAEQLHVGRTTVREALKHLTLAGLLEAKRGSGTYINHELGQYIFSQVDWSLFLSVGEVKDLFELRQSVEVLAARLAAERATAEDIARIAVYQEMREVEPRDVSHQTKLDLAFHVAIAEASHNKLILRVMRSMSDLLPRYVAQSIAMTDDMETTHHEHDAVYRAIAAHDPLAATQAMSAHLDVSYRLAVIAPRAVGIKQETA